MCRPPTSRSFPRAPPISATPACAGISIRCSAWTRRSRCSASSPRFRPGALRHRPARRRMCGVAVDVDDATGLARAVAPLRLGGRLSQTEPAILALWELVRRGSRGRVRWSRPAMGQQALQAEDRFVEMEQRAIGIAAFVEQRQPRAARRDRRPRRRAPRATCAGLTWCSSIGGGRFLGLHHGAPLQVSRGGYVTASREASGSSL